MKKQEIEYKIRANLAKGDEALTIFQAQSPLKLRYFVLLGPLGMLSLRFYIIALSKFGVYFYRSNSLGAFKDYDFFEYDEIQSTEYGKGLLTKALTFYFLNGRKLKLKAQAKGTRQVCTYTPETQALLQQKIPLHS